MVKSSTNNRSHKSPVKKLLLVIIGGIAVFFVAYFIIYPFIGHQAQEKRFNAAKQQCGTDPIVVVQSTNWIDSGVYTAAYTPSSPNYQSKKAINRHSGFKDDGGMFVKRTYDKVLYYACSVDDAINKAPDTGTKLQVMTDLNR